MKIGTFSLCLSLIGLMSVSGCSKQPSFANDVLPILKSNCANCHTPGGEGFEKAGFSVSDYDHVMQGTRLGPVIVPGHSEASTLFQLISHEASPEIQMPPHHEEGLPQGRQTALSMAQITTIRDWIDQGALDN